MQHAPLKRSMMFFFQAMIILMGIAAFAFLLWEPHAEGRNAHATLWEIYFNDPFLAYAYGASVPFFIALFHTFMLLGEAGKNAIVTQRSVQALRTIQQCALTMIACIIVGVAWLLLSVSDDRPPLLAMGTLAILFSASIAVAASILKQSIRTALDRGSTRALSQ